MRDSANLDNADYDAICEPIAKQFQETPSQSAECTVDKLPILMRLNDLYYHGHIDLHAAISGLLLANPCREVAVVKAAIPRLYMVCSIRVIAYLQLQNLEYFFESVCRISCMIESQSESEQSHGQGNVTVDYPD